MTVSAQSIEDLLGEPFPWSRPPVDPPEQYARLREEAPISRVIARSGEPVWLVTRYDDVRAILADPRAGADMTLPGFPLLGTPPMAPEQVPFHRTDPPLHTVMRRHVAKHFQVRRVEAMRPRIQTLVDETIDAMLTAPDRRADLVTALALPVPSTVLSWILGVRGEDRDFFNRATEEALGATDPTDPEAFQRGIVAMGELFGYIAALVEEKASQEDPGQDILGQLVLAERAGDITRQEIVNTGFVIIVAGHDTTASMTATGTWALLNHPDQLAELRADPTLIPAAIEELLRYLTIVHLIVARIATEDIEIGGVTIPKGEGILPLNLAANRDDAHYPDADQLDIHRAARDHFAFGYGIHQCVGQSLARVELHVIFETLIRRVPTLAIDPDGGEIDFKVWSSINGVHALPVRW